VPKARETGPFGYVDTEVHADRLSQFKFTLWDSPDVYFDENIRRMLGNYRYGFTQLADAFMDQGDLESAAYWLKYGEDNIPFREIEHDWTVATLYAYRYMKVNEVERANQLAYFISERLRYYLKYDMEKLNSLEDRISSLDEEIQMARARARTDDARNLQAQRERLISQRESVIEDVSFAVSRLSILQNIFFEHDDEETAELLRLDVQFITDGRLGLPDSIEASRERIEMFGLNN